MISNQTSMVIHIIKWCWKYDNCWVCLRQAVEGDIDKAEAAHSGDDVHGDGVAEEPESIKSTRKEIDSAAQKVMSSTLVSVGSMHRVGVLQSTLASSM